jgi:hypothetical protein
VFVTNHVLSGVLIGRLLKRRPGTALVAGVASHLVLDAIPHWGCLRFQPGGKQRFLKAAKRDGVLGLAAMASAMLAVERSARAATLMAMAGAVLLDLDKPSLHFFGVDPFPPVIQELHRRIQNESPDGMPNELRFGAAFCVADLLAVAWGRQASRGGIGPVRRERSAPAE